ncbi:hypothetical protein JZ751_006925 [Albula glossodonta]|uniref:Perforin-1-like n=1 Tax=Albula glossodonta TaxID=121402 RepID=A0A8T2P2D0_9TELE|nr:hypothetical protein JZ751_006925 [Albula glossodonta]
MHLFFILCLWVAVLPFTLSCTTGGVTECQEAPMVPGFNLAGEGFDVVTMERKRAYVINMETWKRKKDHTCTLCNNPYMEDKKQKLPLAVVDWRALPSCKLQVISTVYESSEDFVNNSQTSVEGSWKVGLDIPKGASIMVGGTHSKAAKTAMEKSKQDKFSFIKQEVHYRLVEHPPLNREFSRTLKCLPNVYNNQTKPRYHRFIHTYGTHFIKKVQLGGQVKSVTSLRVCQAALNGYTESEVKDCLDVEASGTVKMKVTVKAEAQYCKKDLNQRHSKQKFHSHFSDRYTEVVGGNVRVSDLLFSGDSDPEAFRKWTGSLKDTPDVITYSLDPLHLLVHKPARKRNALKEAVEDYILGHALVKTCSRKCSGGSTPSSHDSCNCVCQPNQQMTSHCCPTKPGLAHVTVKVERATGLWGDTFDHTDGFVKVSIGHQTTQTGVIYNNNNPTWKSTFALGTITISMSTELKLEVFDEDKMWYKWWNDLLGSCKVHPKQGSHKGICPLNHGTLYYSFTVNCAPGLRGDTCAEYNPSAMSPKLATLYASRNSLNVTSSLLRLIKMGQPITNPLLYIGKLNGSDNEALDHISVLGEC